MKKIINWLVPTLVFISAILEGVFDIIQQAVVELGLQPKIVVYIRLAILFIGVIVLKLQPPSIEATK